MRVKTNGLNSLRADKYSFVNLWINTPGSEAIVGRQGLNVRFLITAELCNIFHLSSCTLSRLWSVGGQESLFLHDNRFVKVKRLFPYVFHADAGVRASAMCSLTRLGTLKSVLINL